MVLLTWFTCNCISCPACLGKYAPVSDYSDYNIIVRHYYHHHVSLQICIMRQLTSIGFNIVLVPFVIVTGMPDHCA